MDGKAILEDNIAAKNSSFTYFLKDKAFFNKDAFRNLCRAIRMLAESEVDISRTAQQITYVYGEILKNFMYHFDNNDPYRISNMPENYSKMVAVLDKSVEYYFQTRI